MSRGKKMLIGALSLVGGVLGLVLVGPRVYFELIKAGYVRYNQYDRRERGTLEPGNPAPDLELASYAGDTLRLSTVWRDRPLFVILASCT